MTDVIIGVVDSGIRPESPSFSATPAANPDGTGTASHSARIPFPGICQAGEGFDASDCSNKLVGARFYHAGFRHRRRAARPYSPTSTFRPSTPTGTEPIPPAPPEATGASRLKSNGGLLGHISGMAPGARIAMYKACWGFGEDPRRRMLQRRHGRCHRSGGCRRRRRDQLLHQRYRHQLPRSGRGRVPLRRRCRSVRCRFRRQRRSAGHQRSTIPAHGSTTVAAGTHDRVFEATLTLGQRRTPTPAPRCRPTGTPALPMVYSGCDPGGRGERGRCRAVLRRVRSIRPRRQERWWFVTAG